MILAVSLSRYSECAAFQLQLTKLNITSLSSGFFGFTSSTQRPHPAAVPVRSARSRQRETCICRYGRSGPPAWAWKPLCVRSSFFRKSTPPSPEPDQNLSVEPWRQSPRCYLWEVFLGVGWALGKRTNWISIWICEVWPASCEWSHRSSHSPFFWAPHEVELR